MKVTLKKQNTNKSMYEYFLEFSADRNNLVAMTIFNKSLSFDQFIVKVEAMSHYLMDIGVKKGDSVCICLPNIPEAVITMYAVNRIGAIINIVHPMLHSKGLCDILEKTGSRVLFLQNASFYKYAFGISKFKLDKIILCSIMEYLPKKLKRGYKLKTFSSRRASWVARKLVSNVIDYENTRCNNYHKFPEVSGDDIAVYMHSGGTTGEPKTIMLSNKALNAMPYHLLNSISEGENGYMFSYKDAMLGALPLFHGYGLGVCVHLSLCCRMKIVLVPLFNVKDIGELIKNQKITALAAVPRMYQKMLADKNFKGENIQTLRNAYCGGDKMESEVKVRFDEHMAKYSVPCALEEGYGLTETVNVCVLNTHENHKANSIGKTLESFSAKIVDTENKTLPTNTKGELCISSDTLMSGYLQDQETTDLVLIKDENGKSWLKTGDLCYIDDDGFIFFVDRLKRLIKISGMNVFPAEIERAVTKLDFVEQACAVKAKHSFKTIIVLNVILKKGEKLTPEKDKIIREFCEENLSKWAQPTLIIQRDSFPATKIGKVDYKALEGKTE